MPTPTIKAAANIAIVWGTGNAVNMGSSTGFILETLTITPKNGEPIDIEDGDGFTAIQVGLSDGFNAKATVVFDANKVFPSEGANCSLVGPNLGGTANNTTKTYNCTFWTWGFTRSRKKEKLVELNFTHRPNLNT